MPNTGSNKDRSGHRRGSHQKMHSKHSHRRYRDTLPALPGGKNVQHRTLLAGRRNRREDRYFPLASLEPIDTRDAPFRETSDGPSHTLSASTLHIRIGAEPPGDE